MTDSEFKELKADIELRGLLNPIIRFEGKVLDGRHRLLACEELRQRPRFEDYVGDDPRGFVIAQNLKRRHLDESQRGLVGARLATLKWGQHADDGREGNSPLSIPEVAAMVNVDPTTIKHARKVEELGCPKLVAAVESGGLSVSAAASVAVLDTKDQLAVLQVKEPRKRRAVLRQAKAKARRIAAAKKEKKAQEKAQELHLQPDPASPEYVTLDQWKGMTPAARAEVFNVKPSKRGWNPQATDNIEWARWSWNPVTGCRHDCPYCYARDIAVKIFPTEFEPTLYPPRLLAPGLSEPPSEASDDISFRNVFTCSMADLFGQWVPKEWIEAVLKVCAENRQWNFLMLTKFPQRAADFDFTQNVWMGTTVDAQARVDNAERAMAKIRCGTKWLSVEPMLERLTFKDLSAFKWIVIGGASDSTKTPTWIPPIDWIADLHSAARKAGCRIYYKTNCGMDDALRVREFPWGPTPKQRTLPGAFKYLRGM